MLEIRESQIEDIFATQLDDVQAILSLNERLTLIDRQRKLTSGRIDLLFLSISSLHLLELKAVTSKIEFCEQTIGYRNDLLELQSENKIPNLPLKSYLVCPKFINSHRDYCIKNDIIPIEFSPYELLKNYYFKVKAISSLVTVKPSNHGLWNLHLLNPIIYAIEDKTNIVTLSKITGKSKSTVGSYLRLANELGLIDREFNVTLTTLGKRYVKLKDDKIDRLNDHQVEILKEHIIRNPFSSPAIYGIYAAVESIFLLSKNFYPVPLSEAHKFFTTLSGKQSEWAEKASNDEFIMYSNYAMDLGLLAKIERNYGSL
jgi:DNA-binding transcriptional ArsR family regulator